MIPLRMGDLPSRTINARHDSTEHEAADVRPPGDAGHFLRSARAGEREKSVEELHEKPYGEKERGADLRHRPIDDERKERDDARPRTQHQKRAEDPGE